MSLARSLAIGSSYLRRVTSSASKSLPLTRDSAHDLLRRPTAAQLAQAPASRLSVVSLRRYSQRSRLSARLRAARDQTEAISLARRANSPSYAWFTMAAAAAAVSVGTTSKSWLPSWTPTSEEQLRLSEEVMLKSLKTPFEQKMVELANGERINTVVMGQGPPIVMIHGFGGGLAIFASNVESLAKTNTVYIIDLPGFGRSSRPAFTGTTADEAEAYFVDAFDMWMNAVGVEKAIILGHSLGAFLSASWALSHPHRFDRLILVDPFGVPRPPAESPKSNSWFRTFAKGVLSLSSSPLSILRGLGPLGPSAFKRMRPDLIQKFAHLTEGNVEAVADYLYHVNAQSPATGEQAFMKLNTGIGWATKPLLDRLPTLDRKIPVTFIYGSDSWMDPRAGVMLKESMPHHDTEFLIIPDAGHHVYVDQYEAFNEYASMAVLGVLGPIARVQYASILKAVKEEAQREELRRLAAATSVAGSS